jgi:CTP synthase
VELPDAYLSVREALSHAGVHHEVGINIRWLHSQDLEGPGGGEKLAGADGIVVPGGFGERGLEGKLNAARYARENGVPYLGLCLGLQVMVVEFARHLFGSDEANSTEFYPESPYPVISLLSEQRGVQDKGGTMRLGGYPCRLVPGTKAHAVYNCEEVIERHRHRYELNNEFRSQMEEAGLIASGTLPDGSLVEICELREHPWMVGSQFHPEFRSRPNVTSSTSLTLLLRQRPPFGNSLPDADRAIDGPLHPGLNWARHREERSTSASLVSQSR